MAWCTVLLSCLLWPLVLGGGMFTSMTSDLIPFDTTQLNYGVAVTNVGAGEGAMEWIVAGYNGPNLVLQLDSSTGRYRNIAQTGTPYESIMDEGGAAIGVCACDVDGDGLEEIYFLNTNNRYSGPKLVKDKLFKWRNGQYVDLFSDEVNSNVSGMFSGRSVACVDRIGNGKYGILVATYAQNSQGRFGLVEMNEADSRNNLASGNIVLHDVATEAGINFSTGGRGIVVGPILGEDGFSDIYFVNEGNGGFGNRGDNALFKNDGSGHFTNVATQMNMNDANTGRGVTIADFNNDGLIDITYGNWMNDHKLFLQGKNAYGIPTFTNVATQDFANPSPIRTVIAADFDNNGNLDIFMNNIVLQHPGHTHDGTNNLFEIVPNGASVQIVRKDIGDAEERTGYGTGASVADIDNDGVLELLIAHGESSAQGLSFYHVNSSLSRGNNWLRVLPLTQYGAPARGAKVTVTLSGTRRRSLTRVIDGGSGYLCAMEPVAHFGLGDDTAELVRITWPNGQQKVLSLTQNDMRKTHRIPLSGAMMSETTNRRQGVAVVDRQSQSGRGAVSRDV